MSNLHMRSLSRLAFDTLLHFKPNSIHHIKQLHAHLITNAVSSPLFSPNSSTITALSHLRTTHTHSSYTCALQTSFSSNFDQMPPTQSSILVFADWVSREALVFDDFTYIFALELALDHRLCGKGGRYMPGY
ncbi:hypothetical protein CK203_027667 [Vitis vinifera]|uniref:Uncharacterized protein n=1 Tax=Vitis vinifera TaxID=29760 RepID=A0A438IH25_VITVI|nr:hypothetical protein CK203_027667 [Vitis vinifera]